MMKLQTRVTASGHSGQFGKTGGKEDEQTDILPRRTDGHSLWTRTSATTSFHYTTQVYLTFKPISRILKFKYCNKISRPRRNTVNRFNKLNHIHLSKINVKPLLRCWKKLDAGQHRSQARAIGLNRTWVWKPRLSSYIVTSRTP